MKTCRVCGEVRPSQQFRKGHRRCKACTAAERRRYRLANLERERANERRWYEANSAAKVAYVREHREINREEIGERRRKWHAENREAEAERNHRRYWADPEKFRGASARWSRENPVRNLAAVHKRRALVRSWGLADEDFAYIAILRSDPCSYCGRAAGTIDHIEPLYSGGNGRWDNLTASCRSCNSSKRAATLLAFLGRANTQ